LCCPGSGTKRAQSKTQGLIKGSALALQAAFADINIAKDRPVYYWLGDNQRSERMSAKKAVFALTLLSLVPTTSFGQEQCTPGTLKGQYVFTGRGFIEKLEPGVQRMQYGVFIFDGAGTFTGKQSSSRGGKIGREKLAGTYTMEADCSGTISFGSYLKRSAGRGGPEQRRQSWAS
jgi:hypothetical protein